MKIALSLDDYIFSNIFHYPGLYYRETLELSKFRVLNQLFLVNGNGIEYVPEFKNFNNHKCPRISINKVNRIKNGENIIEVCDGGKLMPYFRKKVFRDMDSEYKVYLEKDFNKLKLDFVTNGDELPNNFDISKLKDYKVVTVYPRENIKYEKLISTFKEGNAFKKPYPFSLKYTPLWNSNKNELINKNLIADDWRKGIVWIYEKALAWIESKEFDKDNYFNWAQNVGKAGCVFTQNWNNKSSLEQLCKDYEVPFENYPDAKSMATVRVAVMRKQYIDTAQLIIDTYK